MSLDSSFKIPIVIGLMALAFAIGILWPNNDSQEITNIDASEPLPITEENIQTPEPSAPSLILPKSQSNSQMPSYEILGKEIPAGYSFGNVLNNSLLAGMGIISIDTPEEKTGIRFTSLYDGAVTEVRLGLN